MIHYVYSVLDTKAGLFATPFFVPAEGVALRAFSDTCAMTDHPFFVHPSDYILMRIGTFDDCTGSFSPVPAVAVLTASDVVSKLTSSVE